MLIELYITDISNEITTLSTIMEIVSTCIIKVKNSKFGSEKKKTYCTYGMENKGKFAKLAQKFFEPNYYIKTLLN